jgi:hypothetical protein
MVQMMKVNGVTETIIKKSAELGGDKPIIVTFIMAAVVALLFTSMHGLGFISSSVHRAPDPDLRRRSVDDGRLRISAGNRLGMTQNLTELTTFSGIFSIDVPTIRGYSLYLTIVSVLALIAYILIEFKRKGVRYAFSAPAEEKKKKKKKLRA